MSDDVMQEPWCCLTCSSRFTFGKLRVMPGSPNVHCPNCKSANVHPATGEEFDVPEYHGDKGTVQ